MSRYKIDYQEMSELFLSGMSAPQLAEKYQVTRAAIYHALKVQGFQTARQKRKPQVTKIKRISKVKSLHVRVTATEFQLLQEQATQCHLTLSALVRQLLFEQGGTNA